MRPYVTTSADGRFYFRMLPAVNQLPARGYCFEVTDGPEDRLLWQTGGWYAESVLVATDGQHVAVVEQGRATLYSSRSRAPIVVQLGAGDGVASMPLAESGLVLTLPDGGTRGQCASARSLRLVMPGTRFRLARSRARLSPWLNRLPRLARR